MKSVFAAVAAVAVITAAPIRITPGSQDFGKVMLGGSKVATFSVVPPVPLAGDSVRVSVTGSSEFQEIVQPTGRCAGTTVLYSCQVLVQFSPTTLGVKTGSLAVSDSRGNSGTVPLRGEGADVFCTLTVVPCNYAHLYSGEFSWQIVLRDPDTQTRTHVTVGVKNGVATCVGSIDDTEVGRDPVHGTISGPGLIGVEYLPDPMHKIVYRVTVACPGPKYPGLNSGPASLSDAQNTENQPATAIGQNALSGQITYPAPETDPANNVSGTVTIAWSLKR